MELKKRINDILNYSEECAVLKNILLEVTNACNNQCIFCANQKMSRKIGSMNIVLAQNVLQQAYDMGCRQVGLYATGESLLYPQLEKLIKISKKIGYQYVYLTTNGLLLNLKRFIKLQQAGLDSIKISFNAVDRKSYELIHGLDGFDIVKENLVSAFQYKKRNKLSIKVYVSYVSTKYTHNLEEIKTFFSDKCDEFVIIPVRNQCGYLPEIKYLIDETDDYWMSSQRKLPCRYVFDTACITWEGYLTACCTDFQNYLVYADLNQQLLIDAWHNQIIGRLRDEHSKKMLSNNLCAQCVLNQKNIEPLCEKYSTKQDISVINSNIMKRINELSLHTEK